MGQLAARCSRQVNPMLLNTMGFGLTDVATALQNANAHQAKGAVSNQKVKWQIDATDQLFQADQYARLIVTYRNGAPVRLADLGNVLDSVENTRNDGSGQRQAHRPHCGHAPAQANIMDTVDRIRAMHAAIASLGSARHAPSDRAGPNHHHPRLRSRRGIHTPHLYRSGGAGGVCVSSQYSGPPSSPASPCLFRCAELSVVMYLLGYTLDNLSLMALTVSTGFVVDDAIVVMENITRYLEIGWTPVEPRCKARRKLALPFYP